MSAVGEGPCSTQIFEVHDRRAIRRLLTPPLVYEVYHMIPVQEPLIVYQRFEQQEKLSADMLHPLLTFHCSSRDSLTCEHMVKNWCDIAFLTEHIRNRSP